METAVILNVHDNIDTALDTIQSIRRYATDKILLIVDGIYWHYWEKLEIPVFKLKGFNHGWYRSSYRNIVLSLMTAYKLWGDKVNWYCYMEYDCLIGSSAFKKDLQKAEEEGYWCLGNDFRRNEAQNLILLEKIVKGKFEEVVHLLAACIFYYKDFLRKAIKEDFFERFLFYTNEFKRGFFPFYSAWDLTEHALPTIVNYFGGKIKQLAAYNQTNNIWVGNFRRYPIRYHPELSYEQDHFLQASIMHPLKTVDHPIREFHKIKRSGII